MSSGTENWRRQSAAFALALVIPAPSIGALVSFWLAPGTIGFVTYVVCKVVLYGLPAVWCRLVDREPWSLSIPPCSERGRTWRMAWWVGLLSGVLIGGLIAGTWLLLGDRAIDAASFRSLLAENGLATPGAFLAAALWLTLVNAALEEYVFRWFITTRFERLVPRGAVVLSALAFTVHHVIVLLAYLPVATALLASAGVLVGGLIWSSLYRRCRSIWPGWLSHAIVDAAIMAIGWVVLFAA